MAQKANVTVLVVIVLVVVGLVVAEWYFFDYRPRVAQAALDHPQYNSGLPEVSELSGDTSGIIVCEDPDGGKFYTDADSCEDAKPPEVEELPEKLRER